jgi:hypothetical protein
VPLNAVVSVETNQPLDVGSLNGLTFFVRDTTVGVNIGGSYTWSADNRTVGFVPSAPLAAGHNYQVFFSWSGSVTDYAGNIVGGVITSFTTSSVTDTSVPQLLLFSPTSGLTQAPINSRVTLLFNKTVAAQSVLNVAQTILTANGVAQPVFVGFANNNQEVILTPVNPLASNTTYTITVAGIQDTAGNVMTGPITSSFSTGTEADLIRPSVVLVDPANNAGGVETNALIRVQFSERIDPVSVNNGTMQVLLNSNGSAIAGTASASSDGLSATFVSTGLLPSTSYQVRVNTNGVTDLAGNGINFFNSSFTTGTISDTDTPVGVIAVSPQNGAASVPLNARISVQFSEPMSSVSMESNPIVLTAVGGGTVPGNLSISTDHTIMVLTPSSPLSANTSYTMNVSGVADVSGNVAPAFTSGFSTGTATLTARPNVLSVNPANGAANVQPTTSITVTFSAPIDATTVNSANLPIRINNSTLVNGSYAVNGSVVTFAPSQPFSASTSIFVTVNSAILDTAGNQVNFFQSSFTTAVQSSSITGEAPPSRPAGAALDTTNPLSTSLAGLFVMNEGSGATDKNLVDSNTASFSGTNPPVWNTTDPSVVFKGGSSLSSYLNAGTDLTFDQLTTNKMTIVAKIFVNQVTQAGVCEKNDNNATDSGFVFGWDGSGSLHLTVEKSSSDMRVSTVTGVIPAGQWVQVAFTWDGTVGSSSAAHLFIDAVELSKSSASDGSGTLGFANATNQPFRIGNADFDSMAGALSGKMAYLAVYKGRILSTSEMVQLDGQLPIK